MGVIMFIPFIMAIIGGVPIFLIVDLFLGFGDSFKECYEDYLKIWYD